MKCIIYPRSGIVAAYEQDLNCVVEHVDYYGIIKIFKFIGYSWQHYGQSLYHITPKSTILVADAFKIELSPKEIELLSSILPKVSYQVKQVKAPS